MKKFKKLLAVCLISAAAFGILGQTVSACDYYRGPGILLDCGVPGCNVLDIHD